MKIVKNLIVNEIIIEKSRFITYLNRINNIEEATQFIKEIKKKHYDANHNCVAFILNDTMRSSDDGEPSGTAGVPILEVLKKNNITDTICIVTRYFGGIKLGTGGLIRAYSKSCKEALDKACFIEKRLLKLYKLTYDYSLITKIDKILREYGIIQNTTYEVKVETTFILLKDYNELFEKLNNILKGNCILEYLKEIPYDLSV